MTHINIQPIEKLDRGDGITLDVHSIFYTIQGEGPFAGRPAVFIRLAGCNLQCPGCDTEYTKHRENLDIATITSKACKFTSNTIILRPLVVITGGEPFRQNIGRLVRMLIEHGFHVQIETNGTLPRPATFPTCTIVVSPKTDHVHKTLLPFIHSYKYVMRVGSVCELDGLPVLALGNGDRHVARPHDSFKGTVYLQPMDEQHAMRNSSNLLECIKSCMTFGYTLCLQTHKIINME